MSASVDFSQLSATLGDYCRENKVGLLSQALLNRDFMGNFTLIEGRDEIPLPSLGMKNILQPRNPNVFNPTANALAFTARILKIRGIKVDLKVVPQELYGLWLGHLTTNKINSHQLPFEAFLMNYITKKAAEELWLSVIWSGVYNPAGTTAADCADGWKTLLASLITSGDISVANNNLVATGPITQTNVIDSIEAIYDSLGEAYKSNESLCFVSPTIFDWYLRAYRNNHGANQNYNPGKGFEPTFYIDGSLCKIVREPGLRDSQRILITTKENMYYGVNSTGDMTSIKVEVDHRTIDLMMDFGSGVQFAQTGNQCLVCNDQI